MWNSLPSEVITTHNIRPTLFNGYLLDSDISQFFCVTGLLGDQYRLCPDNAVYYS